MSRKEIIEKYISAYNHFDVEGMLLCLHKEVEFRNISNGEVNLFLQGIVALREQAERAAKLFKEREQVMLHYQEQQNTAEVTIAYRAVLATNFSEELKAGDTLELKGKTIFGFQQEKIISIEDHS
ncbi:nuclear transport factor 2 family protein [Pontibacter sp. HSC-14F20]|uniref:nuclear transport factor 2 family protein n=1 Tax=Pontibacter sp. HSC-14F20 TaxID=2864136 RepID=UPI001C73655B|nr:nuclear transport factor 2 family protein [Pontibacter sp. HSC-14F20]MBX0331693.1 nuclear transport factor 2 family protein [Pontibacter sp. HSC-14F20]